jgi:hypothetical protein
MKIKLFKTKNEKLLATGSVELEGLVWIAFQIWAEPKFDDGFKIELGGKKEKKVNKEGKEEWTNGIIAKRSVMDAIKKEFIGEIGSSKVNVVPEVTSEVNSADFPF